ncbi:MAG: putative Cilia- and flagella-associated protein 206 [Streblomastix strix]|uniref:Cilia- and flagella-associated protein 206 n=1 Tax=Streblomastix strix TaxID=222440 RepID=A0A5J4WVP7_9EUKA|nr:MAG: putative Cilia- and flagella-associated protein 206 [Streblomastix strix]
MSDKLRGIVGRIFRENLNAYNDSEALILFMVKRVMAQHADEFAVGGILNEESEQRIIDLTKEELRLENSVPLNTMKMQVAFYMRSSEEQEQSAKKFSDKETESNQLCEAIIETKKKVQTSRARVEDLFDPLLSFIFCKTAPNSDISIQKIKDEVATALESVLPKKDLVSLVKLSDTDLRGQLNELADICLGIRLFHKHSAVGSEDLLDYQLLCDSDAAELARMVEHALRSTKDTVRGYELEIIKRSATAEVTTTSSSSHDGDELDPLSQLAVLTAELSDRRQLCAFLEQIAAELAEVQTFVEGISAEHQRALDELRLIVGGKQAVPKGQVYPRFVNLARVWLSLQCAYDDVYALRATLIALLQFMHPQEQETEQQLADLINQMKGSDEKEISSSSDVAVTDKSGKEKKHQFLLSSDKIKALVIEEEKRIAAGKAPLKLIDSHFTQIEKPSQRVDIELVHPSSRQFNDIRPHFEGFCPVCLVERRGMLQEGDPTTLGYLTWNVERLRLSFAFSSRACMDQFKKNPKWYVDSIYHASRTSPELIYVLGLKNEFPDMDVFPARGPVLTRAQAFANLPSSEPTVALKVDSDSQTPTHFITQKIVPSYEWNEWALRRKAMQLVQLKTKKTHSAQTDASHFRREAETQAYEIRDNETNTGHNTGQNPKKTVKYYKGLRGAPTAKMSVVTLDLDI